MNRELIIFDNIFYPKCKLRETFLYAIFYQNSTEMIRVTWIKLEIDQSETIEMLIWICSAVLGRISLISYANIYVAQQIYFHVTRILASLRFTSPVFTIADDLFPPAPVKMVSSYVFFHFHVRFVYKLISVRLRIWCFTLKESFDVSKIFVEVSQNLDKIASAAVDEKWFGQ